jgi:glutamate/tyrosine decarboxylase-like PLP-dependent enzyme
MHVKMAKWLAWTVKANEQFEVVTPRRFSLVTFRLRPRNEDDHAVDDLNHKLLMAMNASERAGIHDTLCR